MTDILRGDGQHVPDQAPAGPESGVADSLARRLSLDSVLRDSVGSDIQSLQVFAQAVGGEEPDMHGTSDGHENLASEQPDASSEDHGMRDGESLHMGGGDIFAPFPKRIAFIPEGDYTLTQEGDRYTITYPRDENEIPLMYIPIVPVHK